MAYAQYGYQDQSRGPPDSDSNMVHHQQGNGSSNQIHGFHHGSNYQWQTPMTHPAFAHNASFPMHQGQPYGVPPIMAHLPPSTQDILRQTNVNPSFDAASPQWAAAREHVMKQMTSNESTAPSGGHTAAPRGRARGRPRGSMNGTSHARSTPISGPSSVAASQTPLETPTRGRGSRGGRPRGSGVGRGRGGRRKRKREDDAESDLTPSDQEKSDDETSNSNSFPLVTKSGRSVQKPTSYNPLPDASPASASKKRRGQRKGEQQILCTKCLRGHSPPSNEIVMCDGCNLGYHQWCHDPIITQDVIAEIAKSWFCSKCQHSKETEALPIDHRVSGVEMSKEQKEQYLSNLSADTLLSLLLHATSLHPDLPIFPPSALSRSNSNAGSSHQINLNQTASANHTIPTAPIRQSTSTTQTDASSYINQPYPTTHRPHLEVPAQHPSNTRSSPSASADAEADSPSPSPPPSTIAPSTTAHEDTTDPYPDHSNAWGDPPATYPKPGAGPYAIKPLTAPDDLNWMVDDQPEVFSHLVADGQGGLMGLDRGVGSVGGQGTGAGSGNGAARGAWVGTGDVDRLRYGLGLQRDA